jgi:DNA-binding PadR family transcriptional regulator
MRSHELLGPVELEVLAAVNRGALRHRDHAANIHALAGEPAGEFLVHETLRRCEQAGLLRSERDPRGRRYALTARGRRHLRVDRSFRAALRGLIDRSLATPG